MAYRELAYSDMTMKLKLIIDYLVLIEDVRSIRCLIAKECYRVLLLFYLDGVIIAVPLPEKFILQADYTVYDVVTKLTKDYEAIKGKL